MNQLHETNNITKEEAESRIKAIREEIELLEEELYKLQRFVLEAEESLNNQRVLESISEVSENNSMTVILNKSTKTTPIMDEFYYSDKKYLILKDIFTTYTKSNSKWYSLSLIVRKPSSGISSINSGLTMTDLKKESFSCFIDNEYPENARMFHLVDELLCAADKIKSDSSIIPFEHIIQLGGQTYANQTGYGSEYNGEELVVQGTLYGETTSFVIIGVFAHPAPFHFTA